MVLDQPMVPVPIPIRFPFPAFATSVGEDVKGATAEGEDPDAPRGLTPEIRRTRLCAGSVHRTWIQGARLSANAVGTVAENAKVDTTTWQEEDSDAGGSGRADRW